VINTVEKREQISTVFRVNRFIASVSWACNQRDVIN
jgi:hypothetical protein